jgi:hypothetical protein
VRGENILGSNRFLKKVCVNEREKRITSVVEQKRKLCCEYRQPIEMISGWESAGFASSCLILPQKHFVYSKEGW